MLTHPLTESMALSTLLKLSVEWQAYQDDTQARLVDSHSNLTATTGPIATFDNASLSSLASLTVDEVSKRRAHFVNGNDELFERSNRTTRHSEYVKEINAAPPRNNHCTISEVKGF